MYFTPRKRLRLGAYDYRSPGYYFVTVVTHQRRELFGTIVEGSLSASAIGEIVSACWADIPSHFPNVALDTSVVMPNHLHGTLLFQPPSSADDLSCPALGTVIGAFKGAVTRQVRQVCPEFSGPLWQKNYYEHVVRNERALERIRLYIEANPRTWELDPENCLGLGQDPFDAWLAQQGAQPVVRFSGHGM